MAAWHRAYIPSSAIGTTVASVGIAAMPLRPEALRARVATLLRDVQPRCAWLEQQLDQAVTTAVAVLDVDGAGLMLLDDDGRPRLLGASDAGVRALELNQHRLGVGPSVDAIRRQVMVLVADLEVDDRWPGLWRLLARHGVRAVMSSPIWLRQGPTGSLNVFTRRRRDWSPADRHALEVYAGVVAVFMDVALDADDHGPLVEQLRRQLLAGGGEGRREV
ncbi:MAG TPA: GAF domain-containing protein [Capillimicrobium sp.]|nr:GAF domain-containing protein [Capillimicrobium sp.]